MFDIGFFELLFIAIVGLVVIGPEKLPATIRTCALWFGRIKRSIGEARQEMEKQLGADEIRRELHNEQIMRNLEKMRDAHEELRQKIANFDDDLDSKTESKPADEQDAPTLADQSTHQTSDVSAPPTTPDEPKEQPSPIEPKP